MNSKEKKITDHFSQYITDQRKHITANVLWVHDEDDDITPLDDALKVKAENFPNIRFLITKGLGHRKIYSDYTIKKEVIAFL